MRKVGEGLPLRRACILAASVAALAFGGPASPAPTRPYSAPDPQPEPSASFPGIYVPLAPGAKFPTAVVWTVSPSEAEVERRMPKGAASAGRTEWGCHLTKGGHLTRCRLHAEWPQGEGFAEAARPLLSRFVAMHSGPQTAPSDDEVIFEVPIETPVLRAEDIPGECPPPFCTAVIPPVAHRSSN